MYGEQTSPAVTARTTSGGVPLSFPPASRESACASKPPVLLPLFHEIAIKPANIPLDNTETVQLPTSHLGGPGFQDCQLFRTQRDDSLGKMGVKHGTKTLMATELGPSLRLFWFGCLRGGSIRSTRNRMK